MVQQLNNSTASALAPAFVSGSVTMSSREIAELTGKELSNVHRDIRTMLIGLYGDEYVEQIVPEKYRNRHSEFIRENANSILNAIMGDGSKRNHEDERGFSWERDTRGYVALFRLDYNHSMTLVSGYNVKLRKAIIDRWSELERHAPGYTPLPQTLPEALRLAADMAERNAQLANKVQKDAPKVAFVEHYVEAGGAKSLRETAKILNMPEKAMIDVLLCDKVLFRQSGNLLPHALRQRDGLFTVKTGTSDSGHAYTQTRVTPRGVQWIAERYASELMGG